MPGNHLGDVLADTMATAERRIAELRARLDKQDSCRIFTLQGKERIDVMRELDTLERFTLPDLLEQAAKRDT